MTIPARRSVVVHAHFYQPPREEPWLDLVEREPSAAPFHDWNERIERECYRAVLAARVPASDGRIRRLVNILERISYNAGPTLLEWMEQAAPDTYRGFLAADAASAARAGGHGNAIATPYHHVILPLASHREKVAEVRWGIADFRRRFGREPEGMWLPETAVDEDTLDVVAAEGIRFTILAPHQVAAAPPNGLPGLIRTATGRSIAVFVYDGPISHDVAFGPLIKSSDAWLARLLAPLPGEPTESLVSLATDGETFGHHHRFGEMALAATLTALELEPSVRVENFATVLARRPPTHELKLVAPSSWSCPHGVERWRSDCGCRLKEGTSQAWRAPLRAAFEWLAEEVHAIYDTEARAFFSDRWAARTAYGIVGAPSDVPVRGRELLELERNALRMFSSCGWFFDDVAGVETTQVIRYAARAIDLAGSARPRLEAGLLERLARAVSNNPSAGTAADRYRLVQPRFSGEQRAAAGFAVISALAPERARPLIGAFLVGTLGENLVQTQHRRTGRVDRFSATVHRDGGLAVEADLQHQGTAGPLTLGLDALPERERDLARETLRREALRRALSAEDLVRLAHGSVTYPDALRQAIVRLVPNDPTDATLDGAARLAHALALLAMEGLPVPFDAQTKLWHLLSSGDLRASRSFGPLAVRLGFARDAFEVSEGS